MLLIEYFILILHSILDVNHDELVRYIKELFGGLSAGDQQSTPKQKYFGGDIRKHTSNELTHASLVTEGVRYVRTFIYIHQWNFLICKGVEIIIETILRHLGS